MCADKNARTRLPFVDKKLLLLRFSKFNNNLCTKYGQAHEKCAKGAYRNTELGR